MILGYEYGFHLEEVSAGSVTSQQQALVSLFLVSFPSEVVVRFSSESTAVCGHLLADRVSERNVTATGFEVTAGFFDGYECHTY